jgi:fructose-1,6-bisphosphatase/inositol monophosphatase family enzyme
MEGDLFFIADAVRHTAKFLLRDYLELENLQSSLDRNNINRFVQKSYEHAAMGLMRRLDKYFPKIVLAGNQKGVLQSMDSRTLFVYPIEGGQNFARAIPFFGVLVAVLQPGENGPFVEKALINFPVIGELYSAEKGMGAWLEKYNSNIPGKIRMKVCGSRKTEDLMVVQNIPDDVMVRNLQSQDSIFYRMFGSSSYAMAQFMAGKADVLMLHSLDDILSLVYKFFVEEAGGKFALHDDSLYAANNELFNKMQSYFS